MSYAVKKCGLNFYAVALAPANQVQKLKSEGYFIYSTEEQASAAIQGCLTFSQCFEFLI
jgi:hypothetical protein